jgi:tRNA modification GTPase
MMVSMNKVRSYSSGSSGKPKKYAAARLRAQELLAEIQMHLNDHRRGEILRSGIRLTIFGPTNAGKSSLLNFLGKTPPCDFS